DVHDISGQLKDHQAEFTAFVQRRTAYYAATRAVKDKSLGPEAFEKKLTRVFEALHGALLKRVWGEWTEQTTARIDEFATWYAAEYEQSADDPGRRKQ